MSHVFWKSGVPHDAAMPYLSHVDRECISKDLCSECCAKRFGYDDATELSKAQDDREVVTLSRICVSCEQLFFVRATKREFADWKEGIPAEEALEDMEEFERDGLVTSFCETCQDQLYADLIKEYGDPFADGDS